jgi:hypothetical protein
MRIVERSTVHAGQPGGSRAVAAFPTVTVLRDASFLATYSVGSGKDTDDITVELRRSTDGGRTWSEAERPFSSVVGGVRGSLKVAYLTRLEADALIAVALWIDREAFPGGPLFNPETEGCLPMRVLLADTPDGRSWSAWRVVDTPEDVGPPSLTSPLLRLPDGRLLLSIETNKTYLDTSRWLQRVVYLASDDDGQSWGAPWTVAEDPTGRIANWDQRTAVAPDGRLVSFTWTYDFDAVAYRNIHRRRSDDGGRSWTGPEDLGFADQPSRPAILPDGRTVLAWVDRYGSRSIRARPAAGIDAPFPAADEVVLFALEDTASRSRTRDRAPDGDSTAEALVEMGTWSYGLPFATALPDGDVGVVHYAPGVASATDIRWLRLRLDEGGAR